MTYLEIYALAVLLFRAMLQYCAWLLYVITTEQRSASTGNPAQSPALRFS